MKHWLAACLILPAMTWANETPPTIKPIKSAQPMATPLKNAPPTQVDNLKKPIEAKGHSESSAAKDGKPAEVKDVKQHEVKGAKPVEVKDAKQAEAKPAESKASAAPTAPPVVQYVPPRYGSYRPVVRSKSPAARNYSGNGRTQPHASRSAATGSVTPGLVRVMPASSLPADKIVPTSQAASAVVVANGALAAKPRLIWGETTVVKTQLEPKPVEPYIVKDPALRWQQYSYP